MTNRKNFRQWQARRYFHEFKDIDNFLIKRHKSCHLAEFYEYQNTVFETTWPELPKNICGLVGDIERIKEKLEKYLIEITNIPFIEESYALGCFFNDVSGKTF